LRQNRLMQELMKKIAVIGAGNMGAALIGGILKAGVTSPEHLVATTRSQEHAQQIASRFSITATAGGNRAAVEFGQLIILAVKP
jgi:pyrroline-5-carboxylate reductase